MRLTYPRSVARAIAVSLSLVLTAGLWTRAAYAAPGDLDALTRVDEEAWREQRRPYLLYPSR